MIDIYADPIFKKGKIINTENEEKFHREIFKETGLDVKRSFFEIVYVDKNKNIGVMENYFLMILELLVKDNEISECYCGTSLEFTHPNDPVLNIIWDKFNKILFSEHLKEEYQIFFAHTTKKRNTYISSMKQCFPLFIFMDTLKSINRMILLKFPNNKKRVYRWTGRNNELTHYFIYLEEAELQKDISNGTTEKMRKTAFNIMKEKDYFNYLNFEDYQPIFISKQNLKGDQSFLIPRDNTEIPWI